ncbi:MAG: glycoside hydrolase family 3 N-terminal domain-containing protein [Marinifilaceae bacterium]
MTNSLPYRIFISFLFVLLFAGTGWGQPRKFQQTHLPPFLNQNTQWADSVLKVLSPDERIAQLFMVAAYSNQDKKSADRIANLIERYKIGGLIFFQGNPANQARLTNRYQAVSKVPLLVGMDAENGLAARLKQTIRFPRQMMLGAIQNDELIYRMGQEIGRECRRLGVHVNFAPVLDVNNNPRNPVINARSFGEDKINVTRKGYAYMLGMQKEYTLAVGKHFPGHGDTEIDSHHDLPILNHSRERLDSLEFFPFKNLVNYGIGGMMVSHLNVPALDSVQNVATLSAPTINGILKEEMGFKGLVFTDALNMQGVRKFYKPGEVDAKALLAGNDVLLFSEDVPTAIKEIKAAIERGEITQEEVDQRCLKVLKAKEWVGLNNFKPIDMNRLWSGLNTQEGLLLRRELAEAAITLVKNNNDLLPLKRLDTLRIASVAMGTSIRNRFQEYLGRYGQVDFFQVQKKASPEAFNAILKKLKPYDLVIVSKHDSDLRASRNFGITKQTVDFLSKVVQEKKVIFDLFANPYGLDKYKDLDKLEAILVSYEDTREAQMASAQIIFGGLEAKGKLPVTVNGQFPVGTGVFTPHNRLGYAVPEQVGMKTLELLKIDSIVKDAIEKKATPGCQVLVARKGKVVFHKSYGHHSYQKKTEVRNPDLYDLASVTKIGATVPILMQLVDEGWIEIDKSLSEYLPELKGSNKDTLLLREILAHQARLLPWSPFHWETVDTTSLVGPLFSKRRGPSHTIKMANRLYMNKTIRFQRGIYSSKQSEEYPLKVANHLFINKNYPDTIYKKIIESDLRERNGYKYSDLGFILFRKLIEQTTGEQMEAYTNRHLYRMLGAVSLGYHPLKRYSVCRIVPTQNDRAFRKQLLDGYVHDPTAAMLGGVSGHAGLFSNAADLAKLMQMYLQKGSYGGETYISPETIDLFTGRAYPEGKNRRGIGFDKPELDAERNGGPTCPEASPESFGHSGFTGTLAWVDPTKELVYIFLSNRICPDEFNIKLLEMDVRTKIQQVIYHSIFEVEPLTHTSSLYSPLPFGIGVLD